VSRDGAIRKNGLSDALDTGKLSEHRSCAELLEPIRQYGRGDLADTAETRSSSVRFADRTRHSGHAIRA
jgi:hypothetical protein